MVKHDIFSGKTNKTFRKLQKQTFKMSTNKICLTKIEEVLMKVRKIARIYEEK